MIDKDRDDTIAEIEYCESVIRLLEGEDRGLHWLTNWNGMFIQEGGVRIMIPTVMRESMQHEIMMHYQYQLTEARARLDQSEV